MLHHILDKLSRFKWYFVVILISLPTFTSLLRPGFFPMHDDLQAMRVYQMELCIQDGQIPCRWVPDMGYQYGYPQFEYYGPLPYYIMTASRFIGLSLFSAVKLGLILPLILGNLAMFLLASSLFGPWGGLLSAAAYAYTPFRASDIYSRGAMGETWAFVFLPLILYALLRMFRLPNLKNTALLSLTLAGLLVTHNITTLIFIPMLAILAVPLIFLSKKRLSFVKHGLIASLWASLSAGFFLLPVIFEKGYAHTELLISGYFNYLAHFISLKQLFGTSFWGYGSSEIGPTDDLSFFLGAVQIFLFLISLVLAIISLIRKKLNLSVLIVFISTFLLLASLFMAHEKSTFIWKAVPVLNYLQFPWRFLVTANFFLALVSGFIMVKVDKTARLLLLGIFLILLLLFNASYFRPREWLDTTIWEKFSGASWDRQLTISIFDYLPIYAKSPPAHPAPAYPFVDQGKLSILDYQHGSNSLKFKTLTNQDATITLPQFDFPGWQIKLDGRTKKHHHSNDLGLISFDLPAGNHSVEANLKRTLVRLAGDLSTILAAPLALFILIKKSNHA